MKKLKFGVQPGYVSYTQDRCDDLALKYGAVRVLYADNAPVMYTFETETERDYFDYAKPAHPNMFTMYAHGTPAHKAWREEGQRIEAEFSAYDEYQAWLKQQGLPQRDGFLKLDYLLLDEGDPEPWVGRLCKIS